MAGVHFEYSYQSLSGINWQVIVYDKDTVGTPEYTIGAGSAVNISYTSDEGLNAFSRILFSDADFSIEISNDTEFGYLNEILNGSEDQFYLIVKKNTEVYWRGVLIPAFFQVPRAAYPFVVNLKAYDGLKRLANVRDRLPLSSNINVISYLDDLLSNTLIQNADFGASEAFITTANRYYETSMVSAYSNTTDPLRYTKVFNAVRLYQRKANNTDIEFASALESLEDILKVFGLRVFMRAGHFYVIQVDAYSETQLKLHSYTNGIVFNGLNPGTITTGTATYEVFNYAEAIANHGEVISGEFYGYAPVMRQVRLKVNNLINEQIMPPTYFTNLKALTDLGDVVSGSFSTGLLIRINLLHSLTVTTWPTNFLLETQITIKVGSNYFTNQGGNPRWTTSATDYYSIQRLVSNPGTSTATFAAANIPGQTWYDIITTAVPSTDTLSIQVKTRILSLPGIPIGGLTHNQTTGQVFVKYYNYFTSLAPEDEVQYYYGLNDASSYVYDLGETPISDDVDTVYNGKLMIYNGSAWVDSEEWKRFVVGATAAELVEVLISSIYRLQQEKLSILTANIINPDIDALRTITIDSKKMLMQKANYNTGRDEWSGDWIQIGTYASGSGVIGQDFDLNINAYGFNSTTSGMIDPSYKMAQNYLEISRTDGAITGTLTEFDIEDSGTNIGNVGDSIMLVNPFSGESETVLLSAAWESGATTLFITSHAFSKDFPDKSLVVIPLLDVARRLFDLENP